MGEEAIFVESYKGPYHYHVTFDLDLVLEHTLDAGQSGTIVCKFGRDPAICLRDSEKKRFAKCLQTDGRRTPRDCISSWNELKTRLPSAL